MAAVVAIAFQTVAEPSGTAILTGTVITDSPSPQPVRHATVRLAGPAGMSARLVGTDDEGKFEFAALPAASYSVSASKIGSVTTFYGAKRPGRGPGVPVALLDGERASVVLKLLPGAVITGTIADQHGRPAAGVPVLAVDTRADAAAPARALTDDRGVYRIYGLAPGDYVVSAIPRPGTTSAAVGVSAALAVTDAQARWAQSPAGAAPPAGRPMEYAPIYFPGVTNARAASRVAVAAGEEHGNVGFALQIVATATIAGTLIDHTGQPLNAATVTLYPHKTDQPDASDAVFTSGAITLPRATVAAPKFSIAGVAPGEYTLVARSGSGTRSAAAALSAAPPLWNLTDVTVNGEDQTDLVLRLQPGVKIAGSIAFEPTALAPPADLGVLDITLAALGSQVGAPAAPRAIVTKPSSFQFLSVMPGPYVLTVTPPAAGWTLKSAMANGQDLADAALELKIGEDLTGVTITFTDRPTEFAGRLIDPSGRPVSKYSIVVFTADRSMWRPYSRRIRAVSPATDGSFRVTGLPPGDYAVAAAEDVEAADLADPAFLSQLLTSAVKFTLAEGEKKRQDLRTGGHH
jgi:hypothetical protein